MLFRSLFINTGGNSDELRGKGCKKYMFHIESQNSMYVRTCGRSLMAQGLVKGKRWYSLTADYAFGHDLESQTSTVVKAKGGKVLGAVRVPLNNADFSSFLLQAQASKAKVVGLANAGGDTINAIKQAAEFGITQGGQNLAGLLIFINDIKALGLPVAQGLVLTETFYWTRTTPPAPSRSASPSAPAARCPP